jgi:transcriptional regulator with XRE-family HTH domain
MTNAELLGKNLYELRKSASLSQEELAERLGVSRQAVSKWECGEALPDTENLIAISRIFEVSLDSLVGNAQDGTAQESDDSKARVAFLEVDDDEDDEDFESEAPTANRSPLMRVLYALPYPIVVTVAFFLWGALGNAWHIAWTLFVTIPIYYTTLECFKKRRLTPFAYPVLMTFIYLLIGMQYHIWHPTWLLFVTVPIYYPIASAIERK